MRTLKALSPMATMTDAPTTGYTTLKGKDPFQNNITTTTHEVEQPAPSTADILARVSSLECGFTEATSKVKTTLSTRRRMLDKHAAAIVGDARREADTATLLAAATRGYHNRWGAWHRSGLAEITSVKAPEYEWALDAKHPRYWHFWIKSHDDEEAGFNERNKLAGDAGELNVCVQQTLNKHFSDIQSVKGEHALVIISELPDANTSYPAAEELKCTDPSLFKRCMPLGSDSAQHLNPIPGSHQKLTREETEFAKIPRIGDTLKRMVLRCKRHRDESDIDGYGRHTPMGVGFDDESDTDLEPEDASPRPLKRTRLLPRRSSVSSAAFSTRVGSPTPTVTNSGYSQMSAHARSPRRANSWFDAASSAEDTDVEDEEDGCTDLGSLGQYRIQVPEESPNPVPSTHDRYTEEEDEEGMHEDSGSVKPTSKYGQVTPNEDSGSDETDDEISRPKYQGSHTTQYDEDPTDVFDAECH
jgi:hypothetical protein